MIHSAEEDQDIIKLVEELESWLDNLSPMDQLNFNTFVNLPNAIKLLEKMEDADRDQTYISMATVAIGIVVAFGKSANDSTTP